MKNGKYEENPYLWVESFLECFSFYFSSSLSSWHYTYWKKLWSYLFISFFVSFHYLFYIMLLNRRMSRREASMMLSEWKRRENVLKQSSSIITSSTLISLIEFILLKIQKKNKFQMKELKGWISTEKSEQHIKLTIFHNPSLCNILPLYIDWPNDRPVAGNLKRWKPITCNLEWPEVNYGTMARNKKKKTWTEWTLWILLKL